ncbi:MAG: gamma-glutamyltransferase [Rhodothermales bacterium]
MRTYLSLLLVLLWIGTTGCSDQPAALNAPSPEVAGTPNTDDQPATGTAGMVSSAHPMATQAGLDILEMGGNAFDAAVAVAAMLNVVEPNMSGVGGYGTILVYDASTGQARFLNASGRIPRGVDSDVFRAPTPRYRENRRGPKAVSTPGNANAWQAMWETYGRLPRQNLFTAAIRAAEEGFAISPRLARSIAGAFDEFSDHARSIYGRDDQPPAAGDTLYQTDLANTLRTLAEHGAGAIHGGAIGQTIDAAMREAGSFLTLADLEENEAEWYDPIGIEYRGHEVLTASPPSTAFPSLIRLGLMSRFDVEALGHNSTEYLHRFAEATKYAFWCRLAYAGDPEINPPPLDTLLSEPYWAEHVAVMDLKRASSFAPPSIVVAEGMNTTHFVVADRWGNIVSATQTLGNAFGSRILVEGTGIWLNNSLAYCTFEPKGNPMDAHAGHHKLSGDCPTIILRDGKPWAALGTPGGHTIGQTVPQMVMNLIDFDMDIQQAIAAPRISFTEPNSLAVERSLDETVRDELAAMGHTLRLVNGLGNAHGLIIDYDDTGTPARFLGGADPRGEGTAHGY